MAFLPNLDLRYKIFALFLTVFWLLLLVVESNALYCGLFKRGMNNTSEDCRCYKQEEWDALAGTKSNPDDTLEESLRKAKYTAFFYKRIAVWRKCYILACIIAVLPVLLDTNAEKQFDNNAFVRLFVFIAFIMCVLYFSENFYSAHVVQLAMSRLQGNLDHAQKHIHDYILTEPTSSSSLLLRGSRAYRSL